MYVMTEDNKILNLNHYVEIGIYPIDSMYKMQASYHKIRHDNDSEGYSVHSDDIASFETQENAEWALRNLFQAIGEKNTWDVNSLKNNEYVPISESVQRNLP